MTLPFKRKSYMAENKGLGGGKDALKLFAHLGTDAAVNRSMRSVRLADDHRIALIRRGADRHVQGHLAEEWNAQPLGFVTCAAMAEDVRSRPAFRALKVAHVLHDAEHRHVHFPEHRKPA